VCFWSELLRCVVGISPGSCALFIVSLDLSTGDT
jgi:hypothetical protein